MEEAAGWKVGIPMEHLEGKTSQELSSPVDAEGKSRSAVQIPFWGGTSCFPAGTCLAAVKWILDRYPGIVQSVSSDEQVTGRLVAGLGNAGCCSREFSEGVGRGQAVLTAFTVKSCGNAFTAQLRRHFLLGARPDPCARSGCLWNALVNSLSFSFLALPMSVIHRKVCDSATFVPPQLPATENTKSAHCP